MPKTKYVEIKIENRLPESEGYYLAKLPDEGQVMDAYFFNPEDEYDVLWWKTNAEYWLEEVPDYEEEMKEMLDKAVQYLNECQWHPSYVETYSNFTMNANELLTKLKTES